MSALDGAMPADNARQLTQTLANCNQDLTHRGNVSFSATPLFQNNGMVTQRFNIDLPPWVVNNNYYGVDPPPNPWQDAYRPFGINYVNNEITYVAPPPGGGYVGGDWNTYLGDNNTFDLAPRITENVNQYYGGPTFQVAGDTVFNNTTVNNSYAGNVTTNNLVTNNLNGQRAPKGDKGDPGLAGPAGAPGAAGNPGAAGPAGADGFAGANGLDGWNGLDGLNGRNGKDGFNGRPGRDAVIVGLGDALGRILGRLSALEDRLDVLQNKLSDMNLKATIDQNCNITITGNWGSVVGGVQAA